MQAELQRAQGAHAKWHPAAPEEFGARCGGDAAVEEAKVGGPPHSGRTRRPATRRPVRGASPAQCRPPAAPVDEAKQLPPSIFLTAIGHEIVLPVSTSLLAFCIPAGSFLASTSRYRRAGWSSAGVM